MRRTMMLFAVCGVMLAVFSVGCKKNRPPTAPQASGPTLGKPGATLTFVFSSTDPENQEIEYAVAWGDTSAVEWSPTYASGQQVTRTHSYPDSGVYRVRVKARDTQLAESEWSDSIVVSIGFLPPSQPAKPSGPASCTTGIAYTFTAKTTHPQGDSVWFQLNWGGVVGNWGGPVASDSQFQEQHTFDSVGTFSIMARAKDARGGTSAWSEPLDVSVASVGFAPSVSVDHGRSCSSPSIAIGPPSGEYQPIYVAMQDGPSVAFQKSTNAGTSWLADNLVICQGANPDITTDTDGGIHIIYVEAGHVCCVHSFDGGSTWSSPAKVDDCDSTLRIGSAAVAADAAGHLFSAWNDGRSGRFNIWTSVSTDRGATWSPNVRADHDSSNPDCVERGVCVQPGTNYYFVAADVGDGGAYVYRSRDMGQTFEPGVRLETGGDYTGEARVASDREHVVCGYICGYESGVTKTRTLYSTPDTWGPCTSVTDRSYNSYCSALAMSASGRVHTAQMMQCNVGRYDIYYAYSADHGVTWYTPERVNDDTTGDKYYPDIGADSSGYAYIVWEDWRVSNPGVWFSTNNPRPAMAGFGDAHKTHPAARQRHRATRNQ